MVEGIPDRHEPQVVTDRWSRRSRQLPHDSASDDAKASKRRATKVTRTERKREKRQGCQRLDRKIPGTVGRQRPRSHAVDMSRPRSTRPTREDLSGSVMSGTIHRSGRGRRESPLPPVLPHGAKDSVGCPRGESRDSGPGTHEVRVHAVRLGGRSRLDASSVLDAGRSKGLVANLGR
jgi:hypothetical protein